jgi:hypothetical protein
MIERDADLVEQSNRCLLDLAQRFIRENLEPQSTLMHIA